MWYSLPYVEGSIDSPNFLLLTVHSRFGIAVTRFYFLEAHVLYLIRETLVVTGLWISSRNGLGSVSPGKRTQDTGIQVDNWLMIRLKRTRFGLFLGDGPRENRCFERNLAPDGHVCCVAGFMAAVVRASPYKKIAFLFILGSTVDHHEYCWVYFGSEWSTHQRPLLRRLHPALA